MKKKVIIAYLLTKFDCINNLQNFIKNFKKFKPDHPHKLLICYKLIKVNQVKKLRKVSREVNHIEFIDQNKKNDFDFGSYGRIAKKYPNYPIFFSLGHSYPVSKSWLKKIMKNFKKKTIIGTSASYESLLSSFLKKKKFKLLFNLFNYSFLKNEFPIFPNPHLRTTNFLLYGKDYLKFNKNRIYKNKKDAWKSESGKSGLTNFFLKKDYNVILVNSKGKSFNAEDFKKGETYCYKEQSKQLFSDKHSRKYSKLSNNIKKKVMKKVWG